MTEWYAREALSLLEEAQAKLQDAMDKLSSADLPRYRQRVHALAQDLSQIDNDLEQEFQ